MSDLEFDDFNFDDDDDLFASDDDISGLLDDEDSIAERPAPKASSGQGPARFSAEVNKRIKILLTAKQPAENRREAAYWLGESGEPKAITSLVRAYRKDRNKDVRAAAGYALGQFKALDKALKGSDEEREEVMTLLEGIVNEGKMGKRANLNSSALLKINGALGGVFIVLLLIGLILPSGGGSSAPEGTVIIPTELALGNPRPFDIDSTIAEANLMWSSLTNDATLLGQQYQAAAAGQTVDCALALQQPQTIELPAIAIIDYPRLVSAVDRLNAARGQLIDLQAPYDAACAEGGSPIAADAASAAAQSIVDVQRGIVDVPQVLNDPATRATPTPPPPPDEPTITPSPTITPTPTPTLDPATIRQHTAGIRFIIDDVNGVRGAHTILTQYWTDLSTAGDTDGCTRPPEEIPGDYNLPPAIAQEVPQLNDAVQSANLGLNLLRDGWSLFRNSCVDGSLTSTMGNGLALSQAASNAFDTANEILNQLNRQ